MAERSPSPTSNGNVLITKLGPNDVLLGRGRGPTQLAGNKNFRRLVLERRQRYAQETNQRKRKIAEEVYDKIHAVGGRFVRPVKLEQNDAKGHAWIEVKQKAVAVEKCMQALREKGTSVPAQKTSRGEGLFSGPGGAMPLFGVSTGATNLSVAHISGGTHPDCGSAGVRTGFLAPASPGYQGTLHPFLPSNLMPALSPGLSFGTSSNPRPQTSLAPQNACFQAGAGNPGLQPSLPTMPNNVLHNMMLNMSVQPGYTSSSTTSPTQKRRVPSEGEPRGRSEGGSGLADASGSPPASKEAIPAAALSSTTTPDKSTPTPAAVSQNEAADFLKFVSEQSDENRFTDEQERQEKATLTDEEREAALCDVFGRLCTVQPQSKKLKKDLDPASISFLVRQMRLEIERIPENEKRALLEAQSKCRAEEFSDSRLERFLRCEGMNFKLGARRFVNYWESRREVFGPEKYLLRMTLSEALRDDLTALERGVCRLLPCLDHSDRQLIYFERSCHTRQGYSSESMRRAFWYIMEVAALENRDIHSGVVGIFWERHVTIWHADRKITDSFVRFDKTCYPVKFLAWHVCCPPVFMQLAFKPLLYAIMERWTRCRIVQHEVPESQLLDRLSEYGISKHMLPTRMGGSLELSQQE